MSVTLKSQVEGMEPGDQYTGPNEAWLVAHGVAAPNGDTDVPGPASQGPLGVSAEYVYSEENEDSEEDQTVEEETVEEETVEEEAEEETA